MKVVILAAGKGTRLQPLTFTTPKPLIQVGNKSIIERIFENLPEEIDEVVLIVEHLKEKLEAYLGESFHGRKITHVVQGEKKGTFGALLSVQNLIKEGERFLVLNGDEIHTKEEIEKCLRYPRSLGVQKMIMPNYYSIILNENNYVKSFRPQTDAEKKVGVLVATGAYVLDADIFKHPGVVVGGDEYGLPQVVFAQKEEYPLKAVFTEKWIPINSFEDIERANKLC